MTRDTRILTTWDGREHYQGRVQIILILSLDSPSLLTSPDASPGKRMVLSFDVHTRKHYHDRQTDQFSRTDLHYDFGTLDVLLVFCETAGQD